MEDCEKPRASHNIYDIARRQGYSIQSRIQWPRDPPSFAAGTSTLNTCVGNFFTVVDHGYVGGALVKFFSPVHLGQAVCWVGVSAICGVTQAPVQGIELLAENANA